MITTLIRTVLAAVAVSAAAALLLSLGGCGGGGDEADDTDPSLCYVEGKPMPSKVCR